MKDFIIIGNQGAASYKEIFPYFKNNQLWFGASMNGANRWFYVPDKYEFWDNAAGAKIENGRKMLFVNGVVWFTNITNPKRNGKLDLCKRYSNEYPKYDNYDAIEVSRVENIPMDYDGIMGVPISFLHKYNPEQFEIINGVGRYAVIEDTYTNPKGTYGTAVNGKPNFFRIFIRKRKAK